ncbi:sodium-dependent noradrenaline transporter-like [Lineus longissimus]|uniref:sodium-dependent noradrenaline transporter-like n=1 Tax=Lineus longissimus TaxID=88925 RepID=UPI00315D7906
MKEKEKYIELKLIGHGGGELSSGSEPPSIDSSPDHQALVSAPTSTNGAPPGIINLPEACSVEMIQEKDGKEDEIAMTTPGRETWGKKIDFLLSIIGFAVDLANVWRFPYLCYKNGGGAFLIPYFTMLLFGAVPLFYMELVLGQFHREGAITVWKIAPFFKGVGYAQCLMAFYVALYYNVIIGWSFYYLFSSFTSVLPWTTCNNTWNTEHCWDGTGNYTNLTLSNDTKRISAATEFFERQVLSIHKSSGMDDLGMPRWELVLTTLLVFCLLYFSLWKGVKSSGKVVWVTATMPYIVLGILLIRGSMLPGAGDGIYFFITPDLSRLKDTEVWIDAAVQIFYSVGAGFGVHIAYASYNKFSNNCYRDCMLTACVNSVTSIFSGFVIFSYLGYMSQKQSVPIQQVAKEGPGLVFIVYPEAIATLPGSTFWSIIFFLMLITLGLDSAMGGLESILTGLKDEYRWIFDKHRYSREIFVGGVVIFAFLLSIVNVTYGGMYVFTLMDSFSAGTSILFTVFIQSIAISWFYGLNQFCDDVKTMLGFKPGIYWRICWKIASPLFILTIVVSSVASFKGLEYEMSTHVYTYPGWANILGWMLTLSSMICIPLIAIYKMVATKGTLSRRFALCISPQNEHKHISNDEPVKRYQRRHWLTLG